MGLEEARCEALLRGVEEDLLRRLETLTEEGSSPYLHTSWPRTAPVAELVAGFDKEHPGEDPVEPEREGEGVSVAGRIMALRVHGKAAFADLYDQSGKLQLYFKRDVLGEEGYGLARHLDRGDIVGVRGHLFRTKTGEVTLLVGELALLAKTLRLLPEKFHKLRDVELRHRQRFLDLMVNREVLERFITRSRLVSELRSYLDSRGFLEVETPILQPIAGGATAEPFRTHMRALGRHFYLRIATELYHKMLLVGGMEKIYEIGRIFRNEGISTRHNPEFTMMELYWAYVDYTAIMELCEGFISHLCEKVLGTYKVSFGEHEIDLTPPYPRLSFSEALRRYTAGKSAAKPEGYTLDDLPDLASVLQAARDLGVEEELPEERSYEKCLDELMKIFVEPNLIQPVFLIDFPVELSPFAKCKPASPRLVERFELFMGGFEVANAFTELNDPLDQRDRLTRQIVEKFAPWPRVALFVCLLMRCFSSPERLALELSQVGAEISAEEMGELIEKLSSYGLLAGKGEVRLDFQRAHKALRKLREKVEQAEEVKPWMAELAGILRLCYELGGGLGLEGTSPDFHRFAEAWRELSGGLPDAPPEWLATLLASLKKLPEAQLDELFLTALEYGMPPTGGLGVGIDRLVMVLTGQTSIREAILFPQLRE